MVLGQIKTEEKSNEITAIPQLLECLCINGCIVTIDAMGTQKEIAAAIVDKGAHYVLALKDNQALFAEDVKSYFDRALAPGSRIVPPVFHESVDKNGGRVETRRVWVSNTAPLIERYAHEWSCLTSIAKVESIRSIGGTDSVEYRYYISTLPGDDAQEFANVIRTHWSIESAPQRTERKESDDDLTDCAKAA
jgi:predicted transposase YbfD/YdcC